MEYSHHPANVDQCASIDGQRRFRRICGSIVGGLLGLWLLPFAQGATVPEITIYANAPLGPTVQYWGWDLKGGVGRTNTPAKALQHYGNDTNSNIIRIPVFANDHFPDGSVIDTPGSRYASMLNSIAEVQAIVPDMLIFASLKLQGATTFPAWVESDADGWIFDNPVKKPDPQLYGQLLADYVEWLWTKGIRIDVLGINNETNNALTVGRHRATINVLEAELANRPQIPAIFKGFEYITPEAFGITGGANYAEDLESRGEADDYTIFGNHDYYEFPNDNAADWERAYIASCDPMWHSEVHYGKVADESDWKARKGMSIAFYTNMTGVSGYIWWGGAPNNNTITNVLKKEIARTMLYSHAVKTLPEWGIKNTNQSTPLQQAFRNGDLIHLWIVNPDPSAVTQTIRVPDVELVPRTESAEYWTGPEETITSQNNRRMRLVPIENGFETFTPLPGNSVMLVTFQIQSPGYGVPITLKNPVSGSTADARWSSALNAVTDEFDYNPNLPYIAYSRDPYARVVFDLPQTELNTNSSVVSGVINGPSVRDYPNGFESNPAAPTSDDWLLVDVDLRPGQSLDFVDLWGRTVSDKQNYLKRTRTQDLVFTFFDGPAGTGSVLGSMDWHGVDRIDFAPNGLGYEGSSYSRLTLLGEAWDRTRVRSLKVEKPNDERISILELRTGTLLTSDPDGFMDCLGGPDNDPEFCLFDNDLTGDSDVDAEDFAQYQTRFAYQPTFDPRTIPGLIAGYDMNNAATAIIDITGGNLTGSPVGDEVTTASMAGYALELDGAGDYVSILTSGQFNNLSAVTISAWIRPESFQAWAGIATAGTQSGPFALQMWSDGAIRFTANGGTASSQSWNSSVRMALDEWQHIAATCDGTTLRFYLNGEPDPIQIPVNIDNFGAINGALTIGADLPGDDEFIDGQLDDVYIFSRVLMPDEIKQLTQR